MQGFSISEICAVTGGCFSGSAELLNARITGVSIDSRSIAPGSLFVPIVGERFDGHDFIPQSLERGALAVLSERSGYSPAINVSSTLEAYRRIAAAHRSKFDIPVIGVTGSVGKTTTKELIAAVLSQRFSTHRNIGNLNNQTGVPMTLLRLEPQHEVSVVELGTNHFGEIASIASILRPTIAVLTNIGESHIEHFGTREGIMREKLSLLDHLEPGGSVIVNGDDDMLSTLCGREGVITCGFGEGSSYRAAGLREHGLEGTSFRVCCSDREEELFIPAPGRHMVLNALFAFAVGDLLGMEPALIRSGLAAYSPLAGRMDILKKGPVTLLNDAYNASPTSMRASISIAAAAGGRTVLILGDMLELGENAAAYHSEIGRHAAACGASLLITTGELARNMHAAAKECGLSAIHFGTREELIDGIGGLIRPGDTILVKASQAMKLREAADRIALIAESMQS